MIPVWMKRIKEIVNYGLNAGLCVIINEHWDGGSGWSMMPLPMG